MATTEIYPVIKSDATQDVSNPSGVPDSATLMQMIFRYLDTESPTSPYHSLQDEATIPQIKQWRENLGDLESPILGTSLQRLSTYLDSLSDSTKSPTGSLFSGASGSEGIAPSTRASSVESDALHLDTSDKEVISRATGTISASNSTRLKSIEEPDTPMMATITDLTELMPEFMPEFTPTETPIDEEISTIEDTRKRIELSTTKSIVHTSQTNVGLPIIDTTRPLPRSIYPPSTRPASMNHVPKLKIDTTDLTRPKPNCLTIRDPNIKTNPRNPPSQKSSPKSPFPELEFSNPVLPTLHIAHLIETNPRGIEVSSPAESKRTSVLASWGKKLRRRSQGPNFSPNQDFFEIPNPSGKMLGELNKHSTQWNRSSVREVPAEPEQRPRNEEVMRKRKEPPALLRIGRPAMKKLENIEEVLPVLQQKRVVKQGDTAFKKEFFAGNKGLQMRMARRVVTKEMMVWDIEDGEGKRLIRCHQDVHSLSRRKDFFDNEGNELFKFQKRIGSTRVAESSDGKTLFMVRNRSLGTIPYWTIIIPGIPGTPSTEWIAKGDKNMKSVVVSWGEYEIGRITAESRGAGRKHTYNITVARETNFCIVAALATVFDDLRVDEMF